MISSNVTETFGILLEAGYLYKYKDIVWQPFEEESDEDNSESDSEVGGLYAGLSRKQSNKSSQNNSMKFKDEDMSGNFEKNRIRQ